MWDLSSGYLAVSVTRGFSQALKKKKGVGGKGNKVTWGVAEWLMFCPSASWLVCAALAVGLQRLSVGVLHVAIGEPQHSE